MSSRIKSSFALTVLLAVLLLLPGIADSGRGFVLADVKNGGSGHGLPRVRQRIALRGGTVEIETAPGAGTTVTIMVPV